MALLSSMMRSTVVTGRTDYIDAWFGGRQGGRWAEQTVRNALPMATRHAGPARPTGGATPAASATTATAHAPADPAAALRTLTDLHERGAITTAELDALRGRLGV
jgi:hypothetical protein